ncbi:MAG: hypothetical protein EAY69_02165 [Cytophagales bacterium]|nr:MAG: hypothetical protein EAY69_02165 [Cytophagales bacterium]
MKKKIFFICILICVFPFVYAQQKTKNYGENLQKLYTCLSKTPSFRAQIKGNILKEYNLLFEKLKKDTIHLKTYFDDFVHYSQLFFYLKDNHLGFSQVDVRAAFDSTSSKNAELIEKYKASKMNKDFPVANLNIDSLEQVMLNKKIDEVEGIYYYDKYIKMGLYKKVNTNQYFGVVLFSSMPQWTRGQICAVLYEQKPLYFRALYANPVYKNFILYNNEKFRNLSLINSSFYLAVDDAVYSKKINANDFINIPSKQSQFQYKKIDQNTQYVRLGNFSAMNKDVVVSQKFYDQIKDSLNAKMLIVDLRNNGGGAEKISKKFLKLFTEFAKKNKIAVLINNGTMSEGELFTLRLKKIKNVKVFGQQTKGTITYGSNYGKRETLDNGKFSIYITDMVPNGNFLIYEDVGVAPDVFLTNEKEWIPQVLSW